jgi:hypothetical protein
VKAGVTPGSCGRTRSSIVTTVTANAEVGLGFSLYFSLLAGNLWRRRVSIGLRRPPSDAAELQ